MQKESRPSGFLNLKWIAAFFALLTVVFLFVPGLWGSLYSGLLLLFGVYDSRGIYVLAYNVLYFFVLASAVLLILLFAVTSKPGARVEELAAVYCTLQAFVVQASVSLGFQDYQSTWHPPVGGGGFVLVIFLWIILFVAALFLLAAGYAFLSGHGVAKAVARLVLWFALVGNIVGVWFSTYFLWGVPIIGNFPGVNLLMALTSAMTIYYLWKSRKQMG